MMRPVMLPRRRLLTLAVAAFSAACVPLPSTGKPKPQPSAREQATLAVLAHLASLHPDAGVYVVSEKGQAPSEFVMDQLELRPGAPYLTAPAAKAKPSDRHPAVSLDVWTFDWTRGDQPTVEAGYSIDGGEATTCRFNLSHAGAGAEFRVLPNPIPGCSR
jgi:hypothetical protein